MKKRAQGGLIFGIMIFVLVFILTVVVSQPLKTFTEIARDSTHLDCDNSTITDGVKLTYITIDLALPIFVVTLLASGTGFLVLARR